MIYRFPKPWRYPQASFRSCVRIHHENANKNHAILGVPPMTKRKPAGIIWHIGWGPQDSVQLPEKSGFMVDITN